MNRVAETPAATEAMTWTRATVFRVLWSGWAASVSVVLLATFAVEAVPHARGISFFAPLRYLIITPVCVLVTFAAAFLYRALAGRLGRARSTLAAVLLGMSAAGSPGLAAAAFPALPTSLSRWPRRLDDINRKRLSRRQGTR